MHLNNIFPFFSTFNIEHSSFFDVPNNEKIVFTW